MASTVNFLFLLLLMADRGFSGKHEKALLAYLFDPDRKNAHNILERPVINDSASLEVRFKVTLQQIIDVDEKNQIITTNIWLDEKWNDYNFQWDPAEYGNITTINIPPFKVWKPDLLMYNSADEKFDGTFPTNVVVEHDGSMHYVPPGMFKSTCKIDISWYPFDTQSCELKFGSWTYDGGGIDLKLQCPDDDPANGPPSCHENGTGDTSSFILNGEWDLKGMSALRRVAHYDCCPNSFIDIAFTVAIKRRHLYHLFNLIIPCALISSMALLSFTLPPDAGEKISLGVTILLSLTVFLLLVAETMPPTSDAVPLIGMYFGCIMLMCSMSVGFTVLVLNYHHRNAETHPELPYLVEYIILGVLARLFCMSPSHKASHRRLSCSSTLGVSSGAHNTSCLEEVDLLERWPPQQPAGLHRGKFINGQPRGSKSLLANVMEMEELPPPPPPSSSSAADLCSHPPPGGHTCSTKEELSSIIHELKIITRKLKQEEINEVITARWKLAARVVDRFCLIAFFVFTVVASCSILLSAPDIFD